jgi:hypothetical protein
MFRRILAKKGSFRVITMLRVNNRGKMMGFDREDERKEIEDEEGM